MLLIAQCGEGQEFHPSVCQILPVTHICEKLKVLHVYETIVTTENHSIPYLAEEDFTALCANYIESLISSIEYRCESHKVTYTFMHCN